MAGNFLSPVEKHLLNVAPAAWLALRGEARTEASVGWCLLQDSQHFPGVQENWRRIRASMSPPAQESLSVQTAGCFPAGWGLPRLPLSIVTKSQKEQPTEIFRRWERCPECRLYDRAATAPGHLRRPTVTSAGPAGKQMSFQASRRPRPRGSASPRGRGFRLRAHGPAHAAPSWLPCLVRLISTSETLVENTRPQRGRGPDHPQQPTSRAQQQADCFTSQEDKTRTQPLKSPQLLGPSGCSDTCLF